MSQFQLPQDQKPAYQSSVADVLAQFQCDSGQGLSEAEAALRLESFGQNRLPERPPVPAWRKFFNQFTDPLTVLLLVAMGISFLAWLLESEPHIPYETITIAVIVLLNAILGFMQERRAEEAVAALQAMSAPTARVLREGKVRVIPACELVPGDLVVIEEGDTLPADARLIVSVSLRVAEAALTGESAPVDKVCAAIEGEVGVGDRENMLFSSTAVTSGRGRAIVTATGANTEIGHIADALYATQEETTPLQKELAKVGRFLTQFIIVIAVAMGALLLWLNWGQDSLAHFVAILMFSVSLAVAAVPCGLTAINTIILSLGMARMAKRNVIVRKLNSVETLGSTTVICSDKTGTLTRNEMTVRTILMGGRRIDFSGIGYAPHGSLTHEDQPLNDTVRADIERALHAAELANNASLIEQDGMWCIQGDPTEAALIVAVRKAGISRAHLEERYTRIAEVPFTSERKMMSTAQTDKQHDAHIFLSSKGAPDVLLGCCTYEWVAGAEQKLTPQRREAILQDIESLAQEALRTLGVACRLIHRDEMGGDVSAEHESELVFLGVIGMIDPPRREAVAAVQEAKLAGIRPIMITGDHPITAGAIASELGIAAQNVPPITGAELQAMDDTALRQAVKKHAVFARVAPEHKLRIVTALQAEGEVAAMTGDGVNDAPALKKADIGVAMGITGTDVSKGAADMVLTDDNFASIVAAVEEGRTIFANIQKFLRFLLSSNMGEVFFIFFGVLLADVMALRPEAGSTMALPLLAVQILWVNLLTDSGPALALGVDPVDHAVMQRPPRDPQSNVISRTMWGDIIFVGIIMAIGCLFVTDWTLQGGLIDGEDGSMARAQTMAFNTLVLFQLFNAFNARSETHSAFRYMFSNAWLWFAVAISALLQIAVIYVPVLQKAFNTEALTLQEWLVSIAVASSVLWLMELRKIWRRRV